MKEEDGCGYFHSFTCGKLERCPNKCQRKEAFDDFYEVAEASSLPITKNMETKE